MPTLSPLDIWFPDESSPVAPLEGLFIQQANSIQSALLAVRDSVPLRVADAADRDKKFPKPRQGDRCYIVSKDRDERYYASYSAQNPNGSIAPGWYACGNLPEVYLPLNGSLALDPNKGLGFTNQYGNPEFYHGSDDYFEVNNNREVKAKIAGWYETEFRMAVIGPSTDSGSVKAMILRNMSEWPSTPPGETVIAEHENFARPGRQWLNGHAPRFWMSAGDRVQLGARTINTSSQIRFGNMTQANLAACFFQVRFVGPRRNS